MGRSGQEGDAEDEDGDNDGPSGAARFHDISKCRDISHGDENGNLTFSLAVYNVDNDVLRITDEPDIETGVAREADTAADFTACITSEIQYPTEATYITPDLYYKWKDFAGIEGREDDTYKPLNYKPGQRWVECEFTVSVSDQYFWNENYDDEKIYSVQSNSMTAVTTGTTMKAMHVDITSPTFGLHDRFRHGGGRANNDTIVSAVNFPGQNTEGTL